MRLLHKAEGLCLVSRALSVQQTFEPHIQLGVPSIESGHASPVDREGGSR